jgi:hypothetical protein
MARDHLVLRIRRHARALSNNGRHSSVIAALPSIAWSEGGCLIIARSKPDTQQCARAAHKTRRTARKRAREFDELDALDSASLARLPASKPRIYMGVRVSCADSKTFRAADATYNPYREGALAVRTARNPCICAVRTAGGDPSADWNVCVACDAFVELG